MIQINITYSEQKQSQYQLYAVDAPLWLHLCYELRFDADLRSLVRSPLQRKMQFHRESQSQRNAMLNSNVGSSVYYKLLITNKGKTSY
jgi:hypothetical protein